MAMPFGKTIIEKVCTRCLLEASHAEGAICEAQLLNVMIAHGLTLRQMAAILRQLYVCLSADRRA
jgi:hypothetical protein